MHPDIRKWIELFWFAFLVVWTIAATTQKKVVRREPTRSRFAHLSLGALAAILLFDRRLSLGLMERPFVPGAAIFAYLGLVLTIAGIAFAIWARFFLGGNWSGAVTVKKDHELVCRGPYTIVRHPIYTGVLVGLLGTAIVLRETRGLLAFGVAIMALWMKSRPEEVFMMEQFGAKYAQYKREVKRLIPFIW